ncbi:MAG TPA: sugar ABC transporter ATP-binding protein [Streptosporangiaceae bacterium]|jgi:ribose transport system ATP-binding protein|nr:sugar ABC transporter ATP-binding protein [Streptosporangiaceae bacterium]
MILEVEGLAKRYDSTIALADASLTLRGGQIHALVGENGAGKSTLIKVLTGSVTPDAGTIRINGRSVTFHNTRESAGSGISVVHQERNLVPRFSVAENLLLGRSPYRNGFLDHASLTATARRWLDRVGLDVDPKATADTLSVAQAQLVEIARALSQSCEILLLDEPTSAISGHETETLFALLRDLRQEGTGIMFVSHKLDEVEELCEVATVMRDGRTVLADKPLAGITRHELIAAMVGREYDAAALPERSGRGTSQAARLELRSVSTVDGHRDISLSVRAGEIVGLYGLVGAGRTELARAVLGLTKIVSGTVLVDGQAVHIKNPHDALRRFRMGYVSEDRKGEGLFLSHSIERNVGVTIWDRLARRRGWLSDRVVRPHVEEPVRSLGTKISSLGQAVSDLSGGNQQKASVAKWLAADVDILIVDEPTIGVDVRTKEDMHRLLWDLAAHGKAVLLISSDLQEVVRLSDRVLVMAEMSIRAEVENSHDYDEMSHVIMSKIMSVAASGQP